MANPNASAKFKRKQDNVEAVSVTLILTTKPSEHPQWVVDAFAAKKIHLEGSTLVVATSQGPKTAVSGDMLLIDYRGWLNALTLVDFNAQYDATKE